MLFRFLCLTIMMMLNKKVFLAFVNVNLCVSRHMDMFVGTARLSDTLSLIVNGELLITRRPPLITSNSVVFPNCVLTFEGKYAEMLF